MADFPRGLRFLAYSAAAATTFAVALLSVDPLARAIYRLPESAVNVEVSVERDRLETTSTLNAPTEIWTDTYSEPSLYRTEYGPFGRTASATQTVPSTAALELQQITLPTISSPALELPLGDLSLRNLPQATDNNYSVQPRVDQTGNPLGPFKLLVPANPSSADLTGGAINPSLPQVSAPSLPAGGGLLRR